MFTNVTYVDLTGHRGKNEHFINFQLSVLMEGMRKLKLCSFSNHLFGVWNHCALRGRARKIISSAFLWGGEVGRSPGPGQLIHTEDSQTTEGWPLFCSGLQADCQSIWLGFSFGFVLLADCLQYPGSILPLPLA